MYELKRLAGTWYANGKPCKDLPTPKKGDRYINYTPICEKTQSGIFTLKFFIFFSNPKNPNIKKPSFKPSSLKKLGFFVKRKIKKVRFYAENSALRINKIT